MTTARKLGLLGSLYLAQGLPFGFFTQALPALLRQMDLSLPLIGATSLLALPWALKFLWAPLVDGAWWGRLGRRRSWILPLQLAAVALMVAVAQVDPSHQLALVLAGVLLANALAATQDIATDGLAVELLTPGERGPGNGVQVAAYRMGMIVGGGALLVTYDAIGWAATFLLLGGLLLLATVPIALHAEASPPPTPMERPLQVWSRFLRRAGALRWLAFLAAYKFGEALAGGMLRPFLVDLGLGLGDIGWLLGTAGFTAGLLGALCGGWLVRHLGRYPALLGFGLLQAVTVAAYAGVTSPSLPLLYGLVTVEHFVGGMATAALFTLMMDACRIESAGSDYTLQASAVVLATGTAAALSGLVAAGLGYPALFLIGGSLSLLALTPLTLGPERGGLRVMTVAAGGAA